MSGFGAYRVEVDYGDGAGWRHYGHCATLEEALAVIERPVIYSAPGKRIIAQQIVLERSR